MTEVSRQVVSLELQERLDRLLVNADASVVAVRPPSARRQPVHTVYLPASQFSKQTIPTWSTEALSALDQHGSGAEQFSAAFGIHASIADEVYQRVVRKLTVEAIEDLRIDLEDGYGTPDDATEDADALRCGTALAQLVATGDAPPFVGLRFKSMEPSTRARGLRSLHLFLDALLTSSRQLPPNLRLTLPKVTSADQVSAMMVVCSSLEAEFGLASGALRFEVQVETPQLVLGRDGAATISAVITEGGARLLGLHFGTYDYTASLGISAEYQALDSAAADHAKSVMQVAVAGRNVDLSDGSTNILPVGSHEAILNGWHIHSRLVARSLTRGFYQGWDLHPAQLPSRYAATYAFYRQGFHVAAQRIRDYSQRSSVTFLDEPATARALALFLCRGITCGALDTDEVHRSTGIERTRLDLLAGIGQ